MTIIRIVDFETTGLPEDPGAEICEIGVCDLEIHEGGGVEVYSPASSLCKPSEAMRPEVRAVHHIMDSELLNAPSPAVALQNLMDASGAVDYFAAHNIAFEKHFFLTPADAPPLKWICTYRVALRLWPYAPSHSNQVLRYWLGLDLPAESAMPPHRAGPDAFVTAHILAKAIEHGGASIDDMVRWSSGPALFTKVSFGKHRGALWKDLPTDYLSWIANKSDMDADTKANARYRLKERTSAQSSFV